MWRRRICQHPIVKCAFRESERAREARRPFCSRSQGPVAALRRSSRLLAAAAGQSVSSVGVRSVFLFPRRVRALGFQRLLAEQPSQHGPSGTAPCDQLVRGNAARVRSVRGLFQYIDASACGHCPPWRRRQSDQQTIAVYRGAASEHSPSARFASSARPGDRFKVRARSSALLHSAYCLSWRCTSP